MVPAPHPLAPLPDESVAVAVAGFSDSAPADDAYFVPGTPAHTELRATLTPSVIAPEVQRRVLDGRSTMAHDAVMRSQHVSRVISASPEVVYEYASDVGNLLQWAAGLARAEVIRDGDRLFVESPMGRVEVRFVERNSFGVLDHHVTLPSGTVVTNPVRVLSHPDGAEVIFTVRQIELDDDEFARDVDLVAADLERLEYQIGEQT